MSREIPLPPKLTIPMIQGYLDMGQPCGNIMPCRNTQLCDYVNNKDFKLYLSNGTAVKHLAYIAPSIINPSALPPFNADGQYYESSEFYADRDEIIHYKKANLQKDLIPQEPVAEAYIPPYLDKESEYYSEELDLAILLHEAIHINKYGNPNQSRPDRVSAWLKEYKPNDDISDAKLHRLSSIIGSKKK